MACDGKANVPMLRSPSHESVTTDLSLFSVSSIAHSDITAKKSGTVGTSASKPHHVTRVSSPHPSTSADTTRVYIHPPTVDITDHAPSSVTWFEDGKDLIQSCAALSSALGLQKSFSTSDINTIYENYEHNNEEITNLVPRSAVSEMALNSQRNYFELLAPKLEHASRSCSTWVAVGDIASSSQLPSPHAAPNSGTSGSNPSFTPADLIRSVNKKVRQNYIRKRLITTYKALERLSQSEFNLDRLAAISTKNNSEQLLKVPGMEKTSIKTKAKNLPLTLRDVEMERGKPLNKYERNIMIFNWLHTLDDSGFDGLQ